tara:strand:+ start:1054 stop:1434 length:381 start_codon:yes stop_codon:yes gene_type:complete
MGKEDRLKRRIKKKEDKIKSLTPKAGGNNKPQGRAVTPTFSVVNKSAVNCSNKSNGLKGSCDKGNLKAKKSTVSKGSPFRKKGTTKTVGSLKKRKKLQEDIDNLKGKLSKSKKGSPTKKHANPRYL